jgi:integrase
MTRPSLTVVGPGAASGPPRALGDAGMALWSAVMAEYRVEDVAGREMLAQACGARAMLDGKIGHARKHALKTLRGVFGFAVEIELIEHDPSAGIKVKLAPSDGYWTWTDEEIEQYRAHWPLGSPERLVLEFALETASRRCEVVHLGRQHVKGGRIKIKRAKGCNGVDIPLTPELAAALAAMPASDRLTYLVAPRGKAYSPAQLGVKFAEWATEAGLPQRCRLHGLRKARTAQLASAGASPHVIMAVTGHKSLAEVQRYADKFNRKVAADAAMALLRTGTEV